MLGPSACETLCAPSKSGISFSPSPVELLRSSTAGVEAQMLWAVLLPNARPSDYLVGPFYVGTSLCSLRGLIFFGVRAVFSMDVCHLSSVYVGHCPLYRRCD